MSRTLFYYYFSKRKYNCRPACFHQLKTFNISKDAATARFLSGKSQLIITIDGKIITAKPEPDFLFSKFLDLGHPDK